ncbi:MAG TPA: hypothetical protein VJR46_07585 [Candidatus Dormibacteraeota bacterium]|nr:hypothetical protein [Candidatus Dormibacteraeota bacterium]
MRLYTAVLLAALVALAGVLLGLWWAPFPVALVLGAVAVRARVALTAGALAGLLAWLLPLAVAHERYGVGPAASSLAAIMGFDRRPEVPVVLTLLVGTLLGLTGAWLGSGARGLTRSPSGDSFRHQ